MTHSRSDVCACRLFPSKDLDKAQVRPRWSHISLKKVNSSQLFWRWKQWLLYLPSWESPLGETHTVLVFIQVAYYWPQDILKPSSLKRQPPASVKYVDWVSLNEKAYSIVNPFRGPHKSSSVGKVLPESAKGCHWSITRKVVFHLNPDMIWALLGVDLCFLQLYSSWDRRSFFCQETKNTLCTLYQFSKSFPILMLCWERK